MNITVSINPLKEILPTLDRKPAEEGSPAASQNFAFCSEFFKNNK